MLDTPLVTHPLNQNYLAGIRFFDLARIPAGKIHLAGIDPWRKTHRYSNMTIAIFHLAGIPAGRESSGGDLSLEENTSIFQYDYVLPVQYSEDGNLIWRGG